MPAPICLDVAAANADATASPGACAGAGAGGAGVAAVLLPLLRSAKHEGAQCTRNGSTLEKTQFQKNKK